jgi:predicted dehydrogenase
MHGLSYLHSLEHRTDASVIGIWDHDAERGRAFGEAHCVPWYDSYEALLEAVDAVAILSENVFHARYGIQAAEAGKHILCEKPLTTTEDDGEQFIEAARRNQVVLMTAFPCRFSPAFQSLKAKVGAGEIGSIKAICATNRGSCPFGWFVDPSLSGGGAMIDHVVHVADLLRDLLGESPNEVQAQVGNQIYGQEWEDTAMVTMKFPSGVFATLDSSWSRPAGYKTWGDVTMNVVGEKGVLELDMFGTEIQKYSNEGKSHVAMSFGSNLDALLVDEFLSAINGHRDPCVTGRDGLEAAKVAFAGYASLER